MAHSDQGIVKNKNGEEQPKDKQRAQTVHTTDPDKSVSTEASRDAEPSDPNKNKRANLGRDGSARDGNA
jgi:hypothetical protein